MRKDYALSGLVALTILGLGAVLGAVLWYRAPQFSSPVAAIDPPQAPISSPPPAPEQVPTASSTPSTASTASTASSGAVDRVDPLEEGEAKARRILEPRVWSGRATIDEVRMLKAICRHQKDAACVARANEVLKGMTKP